MRSKANTLRANKVTSNVYAAFADEGKYGAATLFELNDLVEFKPATKEQIAENINQDIADSNELRELHRPTFGTNRFQTKHFTPEINVIAVRINMYAVGNTVI